MITRSSTTASSRALTRRLEMQLSGRRYRPRARQPPYRNPVSVASPFFRPRLIAQVNLLFVRQVARPPRPESTLPFGAPRHSNGPSVGEGSNDRVWVDRAPAAHPTHRIHGARDADGYNHGCHGPWIPTFHRRTGWRPCRRVPPWAHLPYESRRRRTGRPGHGRSPDMRRRPRPERDPGRPSPSSLGPRSSLATRSVVPRDAAGCSRRRHRAEQARRFAPARNGFGERGAAPGRCRDLHAAVVPAPRFTRDLIESATLAQSAAPGPFRAGRRSTGSYDIDPRGRGPGHSRWVTRSAPRHQSQASTSLAAGPDHRCAPARGRRRGVGAAGDGDRRGPGCGQEDW